MNIDAVIAEKLFGWKPNTLCTGEMLTQGSEDGWYCSKCLRAGKWCVDFKHDEQPLSYSTLHELLGRVLGALRKKGFRTNIECRPFEGKMFYVYVDTGEHYFSSFEDSLPLALCKAALLALEGK